MAVFLKIGTNKYKKKIVISDLSQSSEEHVRRGVGQVQHVRGVLGLSGERGGPQVLGG